MNQNKNQYEETHNQIVVHLNQINSIVEYVQKTFIRLNSVFNNEEDIILSIKPFYFGVMPNKRQYFDLIIAQTPETQQDLFQFIHSTLDVYDHLNDVSQYNLDWTSIHLQSIVAKNAITFQMDDQIGFIFFKQQCIGRVIFIQKHLIITMEQHLKFSNSLLCILLLQAKLQLIDFDEMNTVIDMFNETPYFQNSLYSDRIQAISEIKESNIPEELQQVIGVIYSGLFIDQRQILFINESDDKIDILLNKMQYIIKEITELVYFGSSYLWIGKNFIISNYISHSIFKVQYQTNIAIIDSISSLFLLLNILLFNPKLTNNRDIQVSPAQFKLLNQYKQGQIQFPYFDQYNSKQQSKEA